MAGADAVELQAERGDLARIDLDAHGRLLLAADVDLADAVDARDLLAEDVVGVVVDRRERQGVGASAPMIMIGASAGLTLRMVGGDGKVGRQLAAGGVDRRLHVLGGGVDVARQLELQR